MGTRTSKPNDLANVYIFNKIENNKKDVDLLRITFESLMCIVSEIKVQNKTYAELKSVVREIVKSDFTKFKYIVIFILDNENEDEYIWITSDKKDFHLNGDLMTAIYANKTLEQKFRFFVLQTNRVSEEQIKQRNIKVQNCYSGKDVRYFGTSTGCALIHQWKNDEPSPFIKHLCTVINNNTKLQLKDQLPIDEMLDQVSQRVSEETKEYPTKTSLLEPYVLSNAR